MKHKLFSLLAAIGLVASTTMAPAVSAATLLNGQNHYYSVQLRSDKQAIVYGKIVFSATDTAQSTISLRLPDGISADNLSAQQVLAKYGENQCKEYETILQWEERQSQLFRSPSMSLDSYDRTKRCIEFHEKDSIDEDYDHNSNTRSSDHFSPYYYIKRDTTSFEYQEITIKQNGQVLEFSLPTSIQPNKQGSIIVSYTTPDVISGGFGYFSYSFRTLISEGLIDSTRVAIDFDDDLYSSEADQKRTSEISASSGISSGSDLLLSGNQSTDDTMRGIGKGGRYIQAQGKMLPGDTLEVKGVFATNPVLLMGKEIGIVVVVLLGLLLGALGYRRYRKKHPKQIVQTESQTATTGRSSVWSMLTNRGNLSSTPTISSLVKSSIISILGTAAGIIILTVLFYAGSDYYSTSDIPGMLTLTLFIVSITAIGLFGLLIIPGLNVLRRGVDQAYIWALVHIVTIVAMTAILWALIVVFSGYYFEGPDYR